jgi:hypothetical protein
MDKPFIQIERQRVEIRGQRMVMVFSISQHANRFVFRKGCEYPGRFGKQAFKKYGFSATEKSGVTHLWVR